MLTKKIQTNSHKTYLSDHMPFFVQSKIVDAMGWNILCQMQFNTQWKYFNNGFGCQKENDEQYVSRLDHIIAQITIALKSNASGFLCLQECPETEELRNYFTNGILKNVNHYNLEMYNNNADEYYLMTFFDSTRYAKDPNLTNKILAFSLEDGLKNRILPLVVLDQKTNETILVINVHANFRKTIKEDVDRLLEGAKKLGINHTILLGDFNRDLAYKSDEYSKRDISDALDESMKIDGKYYVNAIQNSSFITQYKENTESSNMVIETRDGCIADFPIASTCMIEINQENSLLKYTKVLSPRLSQLPFEIEQKLLPSNEIKFPSEFTVK